MTRTLWKPVFLTAISLGAVIVGGFLLRGNAGLGQGPQTTSAQAGADKPSATPKGSEVREAGEERRQLLETVGLLTATHCYQTYVNIGLIADGKSSGAYTARDAQKLLDSVVSLLDPVERKLSAVGKLSLDDEDRASLDTMRLLSDMLRRQGEKLAASWDSGKEADAARYEDARKDSWAAISKLMGISR